MDKAQLRRFRTALMEADEALAPNDPRYVPNLHGTGADDAVGALAEDILARPALGSHLFYFTGQRGTGKSTELRRLEQQLAGEGCQTVRMDSLDFVTETEKVTAESLLLLVAAGLADWAQEEYKESFISEGAWTRFAQWLQSEVQLKEVSAKGIKLTIKEQQATVAQKVRSLSAPIEWTRTIQAFAGDIVEFIRGRSKRERVVVIVDSLERLRGVGAAEQDAMFNHVVNTFAGDFDRLRITGASVVYSVPPYLALLSDVRNFVDCVSLASVRVYQTPLNEEGRHSSGRRQPRADGLERMRSLVTKRFSEWPTLFSPDALDALALASGGDLRHFMQRLVAGAVSQAQYEAPGTVLGASHAIVARVIAENRAETERLTVREEWPLLAQIAGSHNAVANDRRDSLRALARLMETRVVLNYRNGVEWFDVHPLLWPLIDRTHAVQPQSA
ncbi:MAG: AAA family ATPase [Ramlibacter sp.]|nr:AAA family ATPase [Ramlibacter sp.]